MPGKLTRRGTRRSAVPPGHWVRLEPLAPHQDPVAPNRCWPPTAPLLRSGWVVERSTRGSRQPSPTPLTAGSSMSNSLIRKGSSGRCPRNPMPYGTYRAAHPLWAPPRERLGLLVLLPFVQPAPRPALPALRRARRVARWATLRLVAGWAPLRAG